MLVAMLLARSDEVAEMRRRDILKAALGFTWIAVPNATVAQTRGPKRMGYLSGSSQGMRENTSDILEQRLRDLGWRAGETIEFERRWADGDFSRLPGFASELVRLDVSRADELEKAFMTAKGTGALLVQFDFLFAMMRKQIAELAAQTRIPAIYENQAQALAGGLMSYGGDLRENYREGAVYVDRILKGARPADLPVIQASRFELVLNKGVAKAIGLTIPDSLIARADEVFE